MENQKQPLTIKNLIEPTKKFFLQLGNYIMILIAVTAGFFIGKYYDEVFSKKEESSKLYITPAKNVSVAISQNSELIILDRQSGQITMYQDTVGINIFKLYANQIAGTVVSK